MVTKEGENLAGELLFLWRPAFLFAETCSSAGLVFHSNVFWMSAYCCTSIFSVWIVRELMALPSRRFQSGLSISAYGLFMLQELGIIKNRSSPKRFFGENKPWAGLRTAEVICVGEAVPGNTYPAPSVKWEIKDYKARRGLVCRKNLKNQRIRLMVCYWDYF